MSPRIVGKKDISMQTRAPITRLELAQWHERVTPIRKQAFGSMLFVLMWAVIMGLGFDLYSKLSAQYGSVSTGQVLNILVLLGTMSAIPIIAARQMGTPPVPWVSITCGLSMVLLPRIFLPEQIPVGILTACVTGVLVCSAIFGVVYLVTPAPAFSPAN